MTAQQARREGAGVMDGLIYFGAALGGFVLGGTVGLMVGALLCASRRGEAGR